MQKDGNKKPIRKPQRQNWPGKEFKMDPIPESLSEDSSYISGKVMHPNGGEIING
jgi:hypothetical protein